MYYKHNIVTALTCKPVNTKVKDTFQVILINGPEYHPWGCHGIDSNMVKIRGTELSEAG